MINEITFHRSEARRTHFAWEALEEGIRVVPKKGLEFTIPWTDFSKALRHAQSMARIENPIKVGNDMQNPALGGLGEWLKANYKLFDNLTNRRLSQLGPILKRMGLIENDYDGNNVLWRFK